MMICNLKYLAVFFLAVLFSCKKDDSTEKSGANNWSLVATVQGGLPSRIDFPTDNIGYICGSDHGFIAKTTNGGTVWERLPSPGANSVSQMYAMCFLNADTGFVATDDAIGRIFKTVDGGQTWAISCWNAIGAESTPWVNDLVFTDNLHGIAACRFGRIMRTEDGGQTWTFANIDKDHHLVLLNGISFINSQVGYVVGDFSTILKTTDGGANWITLNSFPYNTTVNVLLSNQFYDIKAFDANNLLVSGRTGGLFRTSDGGINWKNVSTSNGDRAGFDTPTHGMIIGGGSGNNIAHFMETNDAGQTWQAIKVKEGSIAFRDLIFIRSGLGFGISDQEVYRYKK